MGEDNLSQAIAIIKSGDKINGQKILARILSTDPQNEVAWLWLATCVTQSERKKFCLNRVLAINSNNQLARQALETLEKTTLLPELSNIVGIKSDDRVLVSELQTDFQKETSFPVIDPPSPTSLTQEDAGPDPENPESCYAYALMKESAPCIYVTGKAGTGKSFLLRYFVETNLKKVVVLAPTGIAALNVGGQTLHSFFHFPLRLINEDDISVERNREVYRQTDAIIIDEVSMVNANLMDSIDLFMRKNGRDSAKPFGGAQLILFGDVLQLPPVVGDEADSQFFSFHYASPFFFDAKVFRNVPIQTVELQKNYRQRDAGFIEILDAVRENQLSDAHQKSLNARYQPSFQPPDGQFYITLTTTNRRADAINTSKLSALPSKEYVYNADIEGTFDKDKRSSPADAELHLKQGAQVIFVKNDTSRRWVNGTLGRVTNLSEEFVEVEVVTDNHPFVYRVERETWSKIRQKFDPSTGRIVQEVVGKFTQYPLRLAWAITIHKSQGQTYDRVVIDLAGGAFEHGQVYVALSRCRSLEGIVLKTEIWKNDVLIANSRVMEFAKQIKQEQAGRAAERTRPLLTTKAAASSSRPKDDLHASLVLNLAPGVPIPFMRVPAGEFLMGSTDQQTDKADEKPQHKVYLDDYFIGKYPITVAQFGAFVKATGYCTGADLLGYGNVFTGQEIEKVQGANWQKPRGPNSDFTQTDHHPVTQISWHDAFAFCQWVSEQTGLSARLPTEAEWEKAARGTDGRIYPWGNHEPTDQHCNFNQSVGATTTVGRYSPQGDSPYGCGDMSGNVLEWVADWGSGDNYYAVSPYKNPAGPETGMNHVLRGGVWDCEATGVQTTTRFGGYPGNGDVFFGFRCVLEPPSAQFRDLYLDDSGRVQLAGIINVSERDTERAIAMLNDLIQQYPHSPQLLISKSILIPAKRVQDVIPLLEKAIELDPASLDGYRRLSEKLRASAFRWSRQQDRLSITAKHLPTLLDAIHREQFLEAGEYLDRFSEELLEPNWSAIYQGSLSVLEEGSRKMDRSRYSREELDRFMEMRDFLENCPEQAKKVSIVQAWMRFTSRQYNVPENVSGVNS